MNWSFLSERPMAELSRVQNGGLMTITNSRPPRLRWSAATFPQHPNRLLGLVALSGFEARAGCPRG